MANQAIDNTSTQLSVDPVAPNWAEIELPNTWADQFDFRRPDHLFRFVRGIISKQRGSVRLPAELQGREAIPKYVLQEFHGLPNGNYSKQVTRGYIKGFDRAMLGVMGRARQHIADSLRHCRSVLDIGCGGGRTAGTLKRAGVPEVWGLDPSPYLLQHAAKEHEGVHFVQGVAENTGFGDERFDGLAVCFVLHEMPPRYVSEALDEFNRVLAPGGLLAVCEPSPEQFEKSGWSLFREYGLKGMYFGRMARSVFEPFDQFWHKNADQDLFAKHGFELLSDEASMPVRHLLLRKPL